MTAVRPLTRVAGFWLVLVGTLLVVSVHGLSVAAVFTAGDLPSLSWGLANTAGVAATAGLALSTAVGTSAPVLGMALISGAGSALCLIAGVASSFFGTEPMLPALAESSVNSLDRDVDFFASTDFEDLLVFTLDALELLWQDVNLLVELCGDNALGLGFLGLSWVSRRVFSAKRLKR